MEVLSLGEAARRLGVSHKTLADRRYRSRIGIPVVKIGRRSGVIENDLDEFIYARREVGAQPTEDLLEIEALP